jgi:hypothetical protein
LYQDLLPTANDLKKKCLPDHEIHVTIMTEEKNIKLQVLLPTANNQKYLPKITVTRLLAMK